MRQQIFGIFLALVLGLSFGTSALGSEAETDVLGICGTLMQAMSDPPATISETSLGDLTADAVRAMAGTDLAVVPAWAFSANLQPGEVTLADVQAALPDDTQYVAHEITPAALVLLMEDSVGNIQLTESYAIDRNSSSNINFLQISGFSVRYDPNMSPGERIVSLTIDGIEYDLQDDQTIFSIALPQTLLQEEHEGTGFTAAEALAAYIRIEGTVSTPEAGRIHAIAVRDNDLINTFPVVMVALAAIIIAVCAKLCTKYWLSRT